MLQQQPTLPELQPQMIDSEKWLVSQGRLQARNPDNTPASERAALVKSFLRESENSECRQEALRYWEEADRLVKGYHWSDMVSGSADYQLDFHFVANLIYSIKEKLVSLLVEGIPELEFLERNPNQTDFAVQMDNFFRHEWERNNWMAALVIALDEAIKHRTGWLKVFWDTRADGGRGSVRIEPVSNYDLFLHEGAMIRDGELQSKYIIHRMDKTRNEIIAQWKVDPSGEFQRHLGQQTGRQDPSRPFLDQVRNDASTMRGSSTSESRPPRYAEKKDVYQVYECHYQDDSLIKSAGVDATQPAMLQYPAGRVLIECNGHLLHDGPNPAGFCMFVPFTVDPSVDAVYGPSIVNQLAGMQMALNKCISQAIEHTERCSNPVLKISSLSRSLNQDSDIGKPGSRIVTMENEGGAAWLEPPALGLEVKEILALMIELMENVSGVHEVSQGETSPARSGIAIERLQAAAATRSNLRSINFDQGLKTFARNVCSLFVDYVNEDRQYRFLDEDSMMEAHGTFNAKALVTPTRRDRIGQLQDEMMQIRADFMNIVRYRSGEEAEMLQEYYISLLEELQREIYIVQALPAHDLVSFDVRIQTGTRSMTQAARESRAFMLFELDIITEASLLKMLRVPNAHKMLQLKAEERQAMAAAQQQGAQQQLALETQKDDSEHDNEMELQELKGQFDIIVAKIQAKAAEVRASKSGSDTNSTTKKAA
ncbi:hypothetical protein F4Y93_05975 [Candidatus Poribacteria bacterium]|nr:hypothetical protein [Candidatus Poribacteria bacterium]